MIGAIIGDIVGSAYEWDSIKTKDFRFFSRKSFFTDDTVLTIATAYSLLQAYSLVQVSDNSLVQVSDLNQQADYVTAFKYFGRKYPNAGYGGSFYNWLFSESNAPYNSWGNGSAMRVSPVGFAFDSVNDVLQEAKKNAEVTHNHPEGIKGAQATALAIFMARTGRSKEDIKQEITERFNYNLNRKSDDIRKKYSFKVSCQESVPESIISFLESEDFEDALRNAVSLGGDADTMACIAGGIAQAFYKKIPEKTVLEAKSRLPEEFIEIIEKFNKKFNI